MSLTNLSSRDTRIIHDIILEYYPNVPIHLINKGISLLEGPVFEYVSKYVPFEPDSSFEEPDVWINALSDIVVHKSHSPRSSVTISGDFVEPLARCMVADHAPYYAGRIKNMDPFRKGTRPLIMSDFRKTIAVILLILTLFHFIREDDPIVSSVLTKVNENATKIVQTLVQRYVDRDQEERDVIRDEDSLRSRHKKGTRVFIK